MKTVRKAMRPIYEELGILPAANIGPLEDAAGKKENVPRGTILVDTPIHVKTTCQAILL